MQNDSQTRIKLSFLLNFVNMKQNAVYLHFIDILKYTSKKCCISKFGSFIQSYLVHVPLGLCWCPKHPYGWGPIGRFSESF